MIGGGLKQLGERQVLIGGLSIELALLVVAGWQNRELLNTDAIAYIRIAEYWASWETGLMVSGYWGPLFSWLIAAGIKLGLPGLLAARMAMGGSALLFSFGCWRVFRGFGLDFPFRVAGFVLSIGWGVFWSVRFMTPDLLMSGLVALAVAEFVRDDFGEQRLVAVRAGVLAGLAYLAKAVALPLLLGSFGLLALVRWWTQAERSLRPAGLKQGGVALLLMLAVAGPWILVISGKHGGFTISTSGPINHAIAGPPDRERYHPFARTFHQPGPGRITAWEDPSDMTYEPWSPFESREYFTHQAGLVGRNLKTVFALHGGFNFRHLARIQEPSPHDLIALLPGFDLLFLGAIGLAGCVIGLRPCRQNLRTEKWRWVLIPVALNCAAYLPMFLFPGEQRYFYPDWPFVWIAAAGFFMGCMKRFGDRLQRFKALGFRLLLASFALPAFLWLLAALAGIPNAAGHFAHDLAGRMKQAGIEGPVAGSALMQGGRAGLFTAFLLRQPWQGDEADPSRAAIRASGARFYILHRGDPLASQLENSSAFRSLDAELFHPLSEAETHPLRVFEIVAD